MAQIFRKKTSKIVVKKIIQNLNLITQLVCKTKKLTQEKLNAIYKKFKYQTPK